MSTVLYCTVLFVCVRGYVDDLHVIVFANLIGANGFSVRGSAGGVGRRTGEKRERGREGERRIN